MASNNELTIKISANSAGAEAGLKRAQSEVTKLQSVASSIGSKVGGIMSKVGSAIWDGIKTVVDKSANLLKTGITAAFVGLASQAGSAIKRLDTFSQYPQVLQQFGVSADEAAASVSRIDEMVQGLPTSLDSAVNGVKSFFTTTGDLRQSENLFRAVNDAAMVFAAGSTEAVERFSYAYNQSLSAGKITADNFRQMNEAIPGVMAKVADSMGMTFADLKSGLSDGSISIDQFNDALLKLDSEGSDSMEALQKSAYAASGGIATTFKNMGTAVVRGVAEVINSMEGMPEAAANAGKAIEGLLKGTMDPTEVASTVSTFTDTLLNGIIPVIGKLIPTVAGIISGAIGTIAQYLPTLIPAFVQGVVDIVDALVNATPQIVEGLIAAVPVLINGVIKVIKSVTAVLPSIVRQLVDGIVSILGDTSTINTLLESALAMFMAIVDALPQILSALMEVLPGLLLTIIDFITNPSTLNSLLNAALKLLMAIVDAIPQIIVALVNALPTIISNLIAFLVNPSTILQLINAAVQMLLSLVKAIPQIIVALVGALPEIILSLINFFTDPSTLKMMINAAVELFMSLVKAIPQILSALINAFGSLFGRLWDNLKGIFTNFGAKFGESITGVFKNAVNGVLGFLEGFINGPIDLINSAIGAINNIPGVNIGKIGRVALPRLEQGGILEGTSYTGDKQMFMGNSGEMVINKTQQGALWQALSSGQLGSSNSSNTNQTFNISVVVENDGTDWTDEQSLSMAQSIKRIFEQQGVKVDLNNAGVLR